MLLVCAALSEEPDALLRELTDLILRFVDENKKSQGGKATGFNQELAFCAHFLMFLNAALRARNATAPHKPKIFPDMGRKFFGLDPHQRYNPSLSILVFNGQIFGGCSLLHNFYASHRTQGPQPDDDPKLWQKLGLMIACCSEEPEEKCMQLFGDSVIDHPDLSKLRAWQSAWVTTKRDRLEPHKLSDALVDAAERELRASLQGQGYSMEASAHRSAQKVLEHRVQHLHQQIGLEQTSAASKQKLLGQLAGITLEWAKKELDHFTKQKEMKGRASASRLLERLRFLTSDFWPANGSWGFDDLDFISLSDASELYGLFKALDVTQKIENVDNHDFSLSSAAIPTLLDHLDELKLSFQQIFWPSLSHMRLRVFESMQHGVWNEWGKQNPIRRHNIIPLLVEELLVCCSNVRRKAMQLLLASGSAAQALADKKLLADLYRRVHDTV